MGLFGSLVGGLFGAGSSSMQNAQNAQSVRETNQMNYKINQPEKSRTYQHNDLQNQVIQNPYLNGKGQCLNQIRTKKASMCQETNSVSKKALESD